VATGTWTQRGQTLPLTFRKAAGQAMPPAADEIWAGTLDAVVQKLPLRFRIGTGADGQADVRMDSLGQKAGGFRAERVVAGEAWTIKVPAVKGEFAGKLGPDGKLSGAWKQGGGELTAGPREGGRRHGRGDNSGEAKAADPEAPVPV
jgi:hypothetical protein